METKPSLQELHILYKKVDRFERLVCAAAHAGNYCEGNRPGRKNPRRATAAESRSEEG